jgi:diguanylate cyclase (GGDEF)-like protein/PAS domain S-box-containing protein
VGRDAVHRPATAAAPLPASSEPDIPSDVSMLIKALRETDRRLEELTAGEVDTVTDREGRSYLLQRAQERWRKSGMDRQAAILDALEARIILLDREGRILATNESWRKFAAATRSQDCDHDIGRDYLELVELEMSEGSDGTVMIADGIRSVLSGELPSYSCEYQDDSQGQELWFLLKVTPLDPTRLSGAVVMHIDITAQKRSEEDLRRFALAMDAMPDGFYIVDRADMRFVYVNDAACRIRGLPREQMMALDPWELLGSSRAELEQTYDALIEHGSFAEPEEFHLHDPQGRAIWIEVRRHAQKIGGRWSIVVLARDVTARKEAESRIAYLNRVYAVLSGINTLIVRVDNREELYEQVCRIAVEQGALAMTWIGIVDREAGQVVPVASAGMDPEFLATITRRLQLSGLEATGRSLAVDVVQNKKSFVSNRSQDDPAINFPQLHAKHGVHSVAMMPLMVADEAIGVLAMYAHEPEFFHAEQLKLLSELAGDVAFATEQIEKQERLDYLAYYDVLTGLANRTLFIDRLSQSLRGAGLRDRKLAVCLLDLERFKNLNDSLGRPAGDALLRQVAAWLTADSGDKDLVARIDSDRFALLIPGINDGEEAARTLEKSLKEFSNHSFKLAGGTYRIAAKCGVALFPDDGTDADTLFKNAEAALKKAKAGGDRYLFYTQRMTEAITGRLAFENRLRRALELDEYELHYQPKFEVASGKLVGAEALIRWNDPVLGLVPPAKFIPILEETGLIHEVGRWAMNRAMSDYLSWRKAGLPVVRIAVNLSPMQLRHRDFVAEMERIASVADDAAAGLELEITESLIMEDVQLSIANLRVARQLGIRVAIDDFGTGFSSLSYLSKLPVDTVKIDRSFIVDMVTGPEGLSVVSIIINLAHSLRLKVVAEGVETEEQARLLQLLNCDEMQGFLFSRALPAAAFEQRYLCVRGARADKTSTATH